MQHFFLYSHFFCRLGGTFQWSIQKPSPHASRSMDKYRRILYFRSVYSNREELKILSIFLNRSNFRFYILLGDILFTFPIKYSFFNFNRSLFLHLRKPSLGRRRNGTLQEAFLGLSGLYAAYSYQSKSIFPYLLGDVSLPLPIKFEIFNFDRFSGACLAPARPRSHVFEAPGPANALRPRPVNPLRPLFAPAHSIPLFKSSFCPLRSFFKSFIIDFVTTAWKISSVG